MVAILTRSSLMGWTNAGWMWLEAAAWEPGLKSQMRFAEPLSLNWVLRFPQEWASIRFLPSLGRIWKSRMRLPVLKQIRSGRRFGVFLPLTCLESAERPRRFYPVMGFIPLESLLQHRMISWSAALERMDWRLRNMPMGWMIHRLCVPIMSLR